MILVQNLRQLLSGSKLFSYLLLALTFSACSPRTVPVKTGPPVKKEPDTVEKPAPVRKNLDHSFALLLPFELNTLNPETAGEKEISRAVLAIDFFQGFKLGLDSLSSSGHNFKLHVFDTQNEETRLVNLARANSVRGNDIIIGPVYPEAITTFSEFFDRKDLLQVSPLAAAVPSQFNNPRLVSLTNNIDQHGLKIARFISETYKPEQVNVVLINTQKTDDAKFASPIKSHLNRLSGNRFQITERPNAIGLESYLKESKRNLVILTSSDRTFLLPIVERLFKLNQEKKYRIELFGHPNWQKATYLDGTKLQALNTRISSSYYINYKAENVKHFLARYRDEYALEPSEFSFKGFDTAYYFGSLLKDFDKAHPEHLETVPYVGLHNSFKFSRDPKVGFLNTELMLLRYQGFELRPEK